MKKLRYGIAALVCLSIVLVLYVSSCKSKKPQTADNNSVSSTANEGRRPLDQILKLPDPNSVAATVNGVDIKESQINEIMAPALKSLARNPEVANLSPEKVNEIELQKKQKRDEILGGLIVNNLLDEKIKDANIVVTDTEAEEGLKNQLESRGVKLEDFNDVLKENSLTYIDAVQEVKKQLVRTKFIESQLGDQIKVTDEEAKKFYDDNSKIFETPEQVRASHILILSDPNDPNDVKQAAKDKIEDLLKQIKDGADFAELAKANSDDKASAVDGGDLNFFPRGAMVPPFEDAAFALAPGQVSDVITTKYGYHIIKVTGHKDASVISFDDAKDDIINILKNQKEAKVVPPYYESLIKAAKIKFPPGKELKTGIFAPDAAK